MEDEKKVEDEVQKKGDNKSLIAIIVILVIVIFGMAIYIAYDKKIIFSEARNVENDKRSNNKKDNSNDESSKKDNTSTSTNVGDEVREIDLSKSLNTDYVYSNLSGTDSSQGLSMNVDTDKKGVTLTIDWNVFGPLTSASAWSSSITNYPVVGFPKNVSDVLVGTVGQDVSGLNLIYLMEDGTVEYTPVFLKHTDASYYLSVNYSAYQQFATNGPISGVTDVVKLYNATMTPAGFNAASGGATILAAKKDGSFYDLGYIIMNS